MNNIKEFARKESALRKQAALLKVDIPDRLSDWTVTFDNPEEYLTELEQYISKHAPTCPCCKQRVPVGTVLEKPRASGPGGYVQPANLDSMIPVNGLSKCTMEKNKFDGWAIRLRRNSVDFRRYVSADDIHFTGERHERFEKALLKAIGLRDALVERIDHGNFTWIKGKLSKPALMWATEEMGFTVALPPVKKQKRDDKATGKENAS